MDRFVTRAYLATPHAFSKVFSRDFFERVWAIDKKKLLQNYKLTNAGAVRHLVENIVFFDGADDYWVLAFLRVHKGADWHY